MDVRLIRDDRQQCRYPSNYKVASYDRTATRALIKAIRAAAPGHVKLIYFNDPVLIKRGPRAAYAGHDDHLHIRYCEVDPLRSALTTAEPALLGQSLPRECGSGVSASMASISGLADMTAKPPKTAMPSTTSVGASGARS